MITKRSDTTRLVWFSSNPESWFDAELLQQNKQDWSTSGLLDSSENSPNICTFEAENVIAERLQMRHRVYAADTCAQITPITPSLFHIDGDL